MQAKIFAYTRKQEARDNPAPGHLQIEHGVPRLTGIGAILGE